MILYEFEIFFVFRRTDLRGKISFPKGPGIYGNQNGKIVLFAGRTMDGEKGYRARDLFRQVYIHPFGDRIEPGYIIIEI